MTDIVINDTSVPLNLLDIEGRNQNRNESIRELRRLANRGAEFLIPLAAVFETSNHIKRADNGRRREWGKRLRDAVSGPVDGSKFWVGTIQFPDRHEFMKWIDDYPNYAARKTDLNDLSIIKEWERMCKICPNQRVRIWSLDYRLMGYDNNPDA